MRSLNLNVWTKTARNRTTSVGAFADAIRRNPDGELSATTVHERWESERGVRTFDRATDQLVVYATQMWNNTVPTLHPNAQA